MAYVIDNAIKQTITKHKAWSQRDHKLHLLHCEVHCYTIHAARPVKTGQAVCLKHVIELRNVDRAVHRAASS